MALSYTYLSVAIFAAIAIFVPLSMLLLAKLIGANVRQNPIKLESYESAESPIGFGRDVTNDYLHYFPLYLGFEIVLVLILSWAIVSATLSQTIGFSIIAVSVISFVLAAFGLGIANQKHEGVSYGR